MRASRGLARCGGCGCGWAPSDASRPSSGPAASSSGARPCPLGSGAAAGLSVCSAGGVAVGAPARALPARRCARSPPGDVGADRETMRRMGTWAAAPSPASPASRRASVTAAGCTMLGPSILGGMGGWAHSWVPAQQVSGCRPRGRRAARQAGVGALRAASAARARGLPARQAAAGRPAPQARPRWAAWCPSAACGWHARAPPASAAPTRHAASRPAARPAAPRTVSGVRVALVRLLVQRPKVKLAVWRSATGRAAFARLAATVTLQHQAPACLDVQWSGIAL